MIRKDIDAEINRLYKQNGTITPDLVVEAAKSPVSILHDFLSGMTKKLGQRTALCRQGSSLLASRSMWSLKPK
jgi:hypothetical protein